MHIVLDPRIDNPSALLPPAVEINQAALEHARSSESSVDSGSNPESSLDGVLFWICISCGLLLLGMHVNELLLWILG